MGKLNSVFRYAVFGALAFLAAFALIGRDGDGQILMAIVAWPSSLIVGLICDQFLSVCKTNAVTVGLVVFFGAIQFGVLGLLAGILFSRRTPRNADGA